MTTVERRRGLGWRLFWLTLGLVVEAGGLAVRFAERLLGTRGKAFGTTELLIFMR